MENAGFGFGFITGLLARRFENLKFGKGSIELSQ